MNLFRRLVITCPLHPENEKLAMKGIKRQCRHRAGTAGIVAALCVVFMPAFAQNPAAQGRKAPGPIAGGFDQVHSLPPGGPPPRAPDGHQDLSGRWYPNKAGRMLERAYPVDRTLTRGRKIGFWRNE